MDKKAIELSVNFLVIVIISITILSMGIVLIKNFFKTAEEIRLQLDEQTVAQIEEMLDEGDPVAMPIKRKQVSGGESVIFGLGIMNINDAATTFQADIKFSNAFDENKNEISPDALPKHPEEWLLYEKTSTIGSKENNKIPIRVSVPEGAYPGTYIYNVNVMPYNRITKMYVVVP